MRAAFVVLISLFAISTSACAPMLLGAVATTGVVAAQDRSVGNAIDDFGVQTNLSQRLYASSDTKYRNLGLEVVEGRVLMTGRVATQEDRIEAARLAWSTPGVAEVINEVEISDETTSLIRPRDMWISTQLRTRLMTDADVRQLNYHIETLHGTVYLFGIAQDEAELERAISHADTIRGVDLVISHVRLRDTLPPARSAGPRNVQQGA